MTPYRPGKPGFGRLKKGWTKFWMRFASLGFFGRLATRMATWTAPPHKEGFFLAKWNKRGYFAPTATLYHADLTLGKHVYVGDRVIICQRKNGGRVELGNQVRILRDTIVETGAGGFLTVGEGTVIHPRCQLNAYVAPIQIGRDVGIGPNCAFYSYNHGFAPEETIHDQPLKSKGGIQVGDSVWFGVGVIVLNGVSIGRGAVIGAGSVVTRDVPEGGIAVGVPARVVKLRDDLR